MPELPEVSANDWLPFAYSRGSSGGKAYPYRVPFEQRRGTAHEKLDILFFIDTIVLKTCNLRKSEDES